jgi:hypothetical protein
MTGIINIAPATREGSHILLSLTGPSGSGKTYTGLEIGRGLVGPKGRIGFLDTETGRGRLYSDVTSYDYAELTPPFTPARMIAAINAFEDHGVDCLIIDSASHEWEGVGGCHDLAEATKKQGLLKWAMPKAQHKRFVSRLLSARMHIITTLRAREKFTQTKDPETGREVILNSGYHEVQERNFIFEQTVSVLLLGGGKKVVTKCPAPLVPAFGPVGVESEGWLNRATGEFMAIWVAGGKPVDQAWEAMRREAMEAAERGTETYRSFFNRLSKADQQRLLPDHPNLKSIAAQADDDAAAAAEADDDTDEAA